MRHVKIELTDEQVAQIQPLFDRAKKKDGEGKTGIIMAQVAQYNILGISTATVQFIPHKIAIKIIFAMNPEKFIEQVEGGIIKSKRNKKVSPA